MYTSARYPASYLPNQPARHTDRNRQTDTHGESHTDWLTDRQIDRLTGRQTDGQTGGNPDGRMEAQTDRQLYSRYSNCLTVKYSVCLPGLHCDQTVEAVSTIYYMIPVYKSLYIGFEGTRKWHCPRHTHISAGKWDVVWGRIWAQGRDPAPSFRRSEK